MLEKECIIYTLTSFNNEYSFAKGTRYLIFLYENMLS
jgi:hypothetical protein